jgi:S1-C subfamily serine protease
MAFGGGVDVKLSAQIALRAGQVDYLYTKHDFSSGIPGVASHQNNIRASVGIVFQFGGKRQMAAPQASPQEAHSTAAVLIHALGVHVVQADGGGTRITELSPNGTAALAGLHPGDIINAVNEARVKSPTELARALSTITPGSKVRIGFAIHGEWQAEATVTLGNP